MKIYKHYTNYKIYMKNHQNGKNIYPNSKLMDTYILIIPTGFPDMPSVLFIVKDNSEKIKMVLVNSGEGVDYHGIINENNVLWPKVFVFLTINVKKFR